MEPVEKRLDGFRYVRAAELIIDFRRDAFCWRHRRLGLMRKRPSTVAALLVKLCDNAKAEKRPTGFVCNFHPQFRTSFNGIV
jgi:hypothetical protein